jgi:hypothetical protein
MLAVAVTLSLLLVAIPASPALAAAVSVDVDPDEGTIGDPLNISGTGGEGTNYDLYFSSQSAEEGDEIDDEVTTYDWLTSVIAGGITGQFSTVGLDVPEELNDGADDEAVHGGTYYIYITRASDPTMQIQDMTTFTVTGIAEITDFGPDEGTVGTEVEIEGVGFAPGEDIIIEYEGDELDIESGDEEAGSDGKFELTIIIPPSVYGENTITIIGEESLTELEETFFVIPEIIIDPVTGKAGINVTIIGTGFDRHGDVVITFNGEEVKEKRAGSDGSFDTFFTVPDVAAGAYDILAEDEDDDDIYAEAVFTVVISTAITVTPTSGNVDDEVDVSGSDFGAVKSVTLYLDNISVGTATTGAEGNFTATFNIPASTQGSHTVKAEDTDGNSATATLTVEPKITVDPEEGPPGTEVEVTGTGFGYRSDIVTIDFNGDDLDIERGDDETGTDGSFEFSFLVPAVAPGNYDVEVGDEDGNKAEAEFTVVAPEATISPTTGVIDTEVAVSGSGFIADRQILVTYNDALIPTDPSPIFTEPDGSFSGSFLVPAIPGGSRTLTVTDGTNSLTVIFTMKASVIVIPTSGIIGSGVGVGGYGFGASRPITILFNNSPVTLVAPITTGPEGTFSNAQFYVPASPAGTATITITDGIDSVNTSFTLLAATAGISPVKGITGTTVTVSGTNFAAGGTVTIKYYMAAGSITGDFEEFTATATSAGVLSTTFDIPASEGGNHNITINDGTNSISANFTVETGDISISPKTSTASPGYIGMEISISGDGYAADAPVEVTYDGATLATDPDKTNSSGSFDVKFTIPKSVGGEHTITVSIDGVTVEQFTFVMEQEAPPTPQPLLPLGGDKPEQPVQFDWEDVTDDQNPPVTYKLEVATDADFTNKVIEKTELTESEYTITEAEQLELESMKEPYYWHVNAVDSAGNESGWSGAGTFYVGGGWPSWLTWLLIGLGILTVFIFALWLGRRIAFSSY